MKNLLRTSFFCAAVSLALLTNSHAGNSPPGYADFGKFSPSGSGEFVEVQIESNIIGMVARLVEKEEPEIAQLIRGLQMIHVNVIGLDDKNREEVTQRIGKITDKLDGDGWKRMVMVQEKGQSVNVFTKTRGDESVEGIALTVLEGTKHAVLVNIVGDIKPEKLAVIGEKFHINPLKELGGKFQKGPSH